MEDVQEDNFNLSRGADEDPRRCQGPGQSEILNAGSSRWKARGIDDCCRITGWLSIPCCNETNFREPHFMFRRLPAVRAKNE